MQRREDFKIKSCFYRTQDGKCCSPEIYRKVDGMNTGMPCPFDAAACAFVLDGIDNRLGNLRCLEFCPNREKEASL
jgi:hypothetical protein